MKILPRQIRTQMRRYFVVISGIPGSGKSTLAQRLAPALSLPLLDKDTILERLFELKGVGGLAWRRALSRESDLLFQEEAAASNGAVLVSHWHLPGMAADSGTPTNWLAQLPGELVNVHCKCDADVAVERFIRRNRHVGHLDNKKLRADIMSDVRAVADLGPLNIGRRVDVDTTEAPELEALLREIHTALN
jgi:AAA domain